MLVKPDTVKVESKPNLLPLLSPNHLEDAADVESLLLDLPDPLDLMELTEKTELLENPETTELMDPHHHHNNPSTGASNALMLPLDLPDLLDLKDLPVTLDLTDLLLMA